MAKYDNQNHPFIYDRATGEKIPVSKEVHDAYYGEAARIWVKERAHGRCVCPQSKVWACDGDCLKRIFDKQTKTWFEVTTERYIEFDRWRTRIRKREQYHGRCVCPRSKWWLCDGMCDDCEFHAPGDTLSLDVPTSNDDGDEVTLLDMLEDLAPSFEEVICDKAELDQLFDRLNELMPEAVRIGKLRQEGLSDEAIAKIVGIKRTTFRSQLEKAKAQLAAEFPDRF